LDLLTKALSANKVQRFDLVQRLGNDGEKLRVLLELWLLWWRDMILAANNCLDLTVNVDMRDLLKAQALKLGSAKAEQMVRAILRTQEALGQNVNARLALEVLMLDMPVLKL
jgi:DNA polymerase-3 subunit delta'